MKDLYYFTTYLKRIFYLLGIYTTSRIFFYYNNIDSFSSAQIIEIIEGIRFDISAISYLFIPIWGVYIFLSLPSFNQNSFLFNDILITFSIKGK